MRTDITQDTTELEMVLVTASMNHEYAKKELDRSKSFYRREELLRRMSHLKSLYFNARESLAETDPLKLASLEEELRIQKQTVFPEHLI